MSQFLLYNHSLCHNPYSTTIAYVTTPKSTSISHMIITEDPLLKVQRSVANVTRPLCLTPIILPILSQTPTSDDQS